jgi:APA family basic amino acid/polyamine antiporter
MPTPEPKAMPAAFGVPTAAFVIVASMVGTGVLLTSGYTVYRVGSNQLMLALWVLGGIVAACGALTLCELTAALPRTGGDYVYLHEAYGPPVAFLTGWVSFLIGFSAPAASAGFGAAKYLTAPLNLGGPTALLVQRGIATALILTFAVVHNTGRERTARVQAVITGVKLGLLGLLMVAGLVAGRHNFGHLADRPPELTWDLVTAMTFSMVYISYAYTGWNAASYMAGEFVDPQRQLPRAILLATAGVTVLYLGLNLVYALALSADDIKAIVDSPSNTATPPIDAVAPVAELAARRLFGAGVAGPLSVAVGLMLLSSLSAYVLTGPRVLYAMAAAGQFPSAAGKLSAGAGTPAVATALQTVVTLALLWSGTFESLLIYTSVGLSLFAMLAVASVYVLRWRRPELPRPFRTPGYPLTPAVFLLVTGVLTRAAFKMRPTESTYALASILAGLPVYYAWQALGGRTSSANGGA